MSVFLQSARIANLNTGGTMNCLPLHSMRNAVLERYEDKFLPVRSTEGLFKKNVG